MTSVTLKSPAKLNLYLKVIGKRADGFHELVTLFERIDLHDILRFQNNASGKIRIVCRHPQVPKGPKNLVYQVAQRLRKDFGLAQGVTVTIQKRIPIAAGLAGGSSNAATTLLGLNRLWGLGLSQQKLIEYANQLGSDITFFLHDCRWALGQGRGEKITPLRISARCSQILVVPKIPMLSRDVFGALNLPVTLSADPTGTASSKPLRSRPDPRNLKLTKKESNVNILSHFLQANDFERVGKCLHNDLEVPILKLRPELAQVKRRLQELNPCGTSFSGSGPSVFSVVKNLREAKKKRALLKKHYGQVFAVRTL